MGSCFFKSGKVLRSLRWYLILKGNTRSILNKSSSAVPSRHVQPVTQSCQFYSMITATPCFPSPLSLSGVGRHYFRCGSPGGS